jgi:uncharacterized membrane protein
MVKQFVIAMVAFVVLDGLWLGVIAADFYRRSLAPIARMADGRLAPIWPIAALIYPVMALGVSIFVLARAASPREALQLGAALGAITFAVYDLTNHSTLRDWRAAMTVVDIGWGAFLFATASWLAATLGR